MRNLNKVKIQNAKNIAMTIGIIFLLSACGSSDNGTDNTSDDSSTLSNVELPYAYLEFTGNVEVVVDGDEIVLEATGRPNHTSPYWNPNNASGLYVAPDPSVTTVSQMSPGFIENYINLYTLRVPAYPEMAANTTATGLGAIGIAVSGVPIFNDQEGPNIALDIGVISGFDINGAHTGPETYHYHLEPKAISNDDAELVGVIADGFMLYGRQCYSTPGTYPTDLDESGGHISLTQHSGGEEDYHYHILNELYLGGYYLAFPGDYQGAPQSINR